MLSELYTGFDFLSGSVHFVYQGKSPCAGVVYCDSLKLLGFLFFWLYMVLGKTMGWLFTLLLLL